MKATSPFLLVNFAGDLPTGRVDGSSPLKSLAFVDIVNVVAKPGSLTRIVYEDIYNLHTSTLASSHLNNHSGCLAPHIPLLLTAVSSISLVETSTTTSP